MICRRNSGEKIQHCKSDHARISEFKKVKLLNRAGKIRFSVARKPVFLKASSGECSAPRNFFAPCDFSRYTCSPHRVPRRVPSETVYGKINLENKFKYICPSERPRWHGDIKKHWRSSGVFIVNFEKIPHPFLVFHYWVWESVAGCVYQQRSKYRQVKITEHGSTGTSYAV